MPPRNVESLSLVTDDAATPVDFDTHQPEATDVSAAVLPPDVKPLQVRRCIVWRNVFTFSLLHLAGVYGAWLTPAARWPTLAWFCLVYAAGALGITAGAHRLWAHRAYTARLPLRCFLTACQSAAFQNDVIEWCRDHRTHHRHSETDADPHNARRGFFFAHVGWLLQRKHPEVLAKGRLVDISDLLNDPVLRLQRRYYLRSVLVLAILVPTLVPWYVWGESLQVAYFMAVLRLVLSLNATWLVNSAAHLYGNRPYDRHIGPVENVLVSVGAVGEGFHNYHHTFPHDYRASEYGWRLNFTTWFIDLMAWCGQVTHRTRVTDQTVRRRCARTGDGSSGMHLLRATGALGFRQPDPAPVSQRQHLHDE